MRNVRATSCADATAVTTRKKAIAKGRTREQLCRESIEGVNMRASWRLNVRRTRRTLIYKDAALLGFASSRSLALADRTQHFHCLPFSPRWAQSARGLEGWRTPRRFAHFESHWPTRQCLGLRWPSTAFHFGSARGSVNRSTSSILEKSLRVTDTRSANSLTATLDRTR